jgi:hypothetical protein
MRKIFQYGGIAASIVLIAFGIGAVYMGIDGRGYVRDNLAAENIVGTPDSTIPGQKVDTGSEAQAFAKIMRHHTLEATGGKTYAQMGQYLDANGKPTDDKSAAAIDPKTQQPVANAQRNIWVTETALTTALNTSYFAEQVANFAIVMGIALLLAGLGFGVLTFKALPATDRKEARAPGHGCGADRLSANTASLQHPPPRPCRRGGVVALGRAEPGSTGEGGRRRARECSGRSGPVVRVLGERGGDGLAQ